MNRLSIIALTSLVLGCATKKDAVFDKNQQNWFELNAFQISNELPNLAMPIDAFQVYGIQPLLMDSLSNIPLDSAYLVQKPTFISLPFSSKRSRFRLFPSELIPTSLRHEYPQVKAFDAFSEDGETLHGSVVFFDNKITAVLTDGKEVQFLDPTEKTGRYVQYEIGQPAMKPLMQQFREVVRTQTIQQKLYRGRVAGAAAPHRLFRIAISATGEYTQFMGSKTHAYAAIVSSLSRVNSIYQNELGIRFQLVDKEKELIFEDPMLDPFSNHDANRMLDENQSLVDSIVKPRHYDLAHVYSTTKGGAAIQGSVGKRGQKAMGVSGLRTPQGDEFDVSYVCHEIGHQFGASHVFNGPTCSNRSREHAMEPGSGSTIMSYAGICGWLDNLQYKSDPYFNAHSLLEIDQYLNDCQCAWKEFGNNHNPSIMLDKSDVVIPRFTPFILQGSGSDVDGDSISFAWEQQNPGMDDVCFPDCQTKSTPNFRSFRPSSSGYRYFPQLPEVLSNIVSKGEVYNSIDRVLTFSFTVRDNRGGYTSATKKVIVTKAGPLRITDIGSEPWVAGSTQRITWDQGDTHFSPINCQRVRILLSTNNGESFDHELIAATSNDCAEEIQVPDVETPYARIMILAVDNIFFAVSEFSFEIRKTTL